MVVGSTEGWTLFLVTGGKHLGEYLTKAISTEHSRVNSEILVVNNDITV